MRQLLFHELTTDKLYYASIIDEKRIDIMKGLSYFPKKIRFYKSSTELYGDLNSLTGSANKINICADFKEDVISDVTRRTPSDVSIDNVKSALQKYEINDDSDGLSYSYKLEGDALDKAANDVLLNKELQKSNIDQMLKGEIPLKYLGVIDFSTNENDTKNLMKRILMAIV